MAGEMAEQDGDPPTRWGRQLRPGHDLDREGLRHGAVPPIGPSRVTRHGQSAAHLSPKVALQTLLRGRMENHIKAFKTHLAADRTSCCRATANQMRLFLHIGAYWLMWSLRAAMPRRSIWRVAQFDTLRLRLIKLAARVEVLKRKVRLHLPHSTPNQPIFAYAMIRLSRMVI